VNKKKLSERSARRISMYSNIKPENRLQDSKGKLKVSYLGLGALPQEGQDRVDLENGQVGRFRGLRNTLNKDLQSLFSSLGLRSLLGYMTRRRMKGQTQFG
nr:CBL-interacting serine/threonine-protein kinase 24-like [Tanacetum cinerariifolium]